MRNERGFTLIELVIVMVVLGIMAALAIPKFLDLSGDAKKSAVQGALGGTRSAIANFYAKQAASTGTGAYPTVAQLEDSTSVMDGPMADNPYDSTSPKNEVSPTTASAKGTAPCIDSVTTAASVKSWCYKASTGEFWTNTSVASENSY